MKVFLSYASEDREGADLVARWLDDKGVAFFDFRTPDRNGGRFATSRPEAMAAADFMLVLLSPALLNSKWCRQDLELGLDQLCTRSDPDGAFIHVLQVADVPSEYDGELLNYDWIDFTSPRRAESALRELSYRLRIASRPAAKGNDGQDAIIKRGIPTPQPEPALLSDEYTIMTDDKTDDKHKKVMVIYGHDTEANKALFDCLRAMSLQPQEWGTAYPAEPGGQPIYWRGSRCGIQERAGRSRLLYPG